MFYALQNTNALFSDTRPDPSIQIVSADLPALHNSAHPFVAYAFRSKTGKPIVAYWLAAHSLPGNVFVPIHADLKIRNSGIRRAVLIDVVSGAIEPIDKPEGSDVFPNLPVRDSVMAIAGDDYFDWLVLPEAPHSLVAIAADSAVRRGDPHRQAAGRPSRVHRRQPSGGRGVLPREGSEWQRRIGVFECGAGAPLAATPNRLALRKLFRHQPHDVALAAGRPVRLLSHVFVAENSQVAEIPRQLVGLKHVLLVSGKSFDDQKAAGLQRIAQALDGAGLRAMIPGVHIEERDQVPTAAAEIVVVQPIDHRVQLNSNLGRVPLRLRHGDVGEIYAGHLPTLLREIDRVAALSHAEVDRQAGMPSTNSLHEQPARLMIELKFRIAVLAVPEIAIARI